MFGHRLKILRSGEPRCYTALATVVSERSCNNIFSRKYWTFRSSDEKNTWLLSLKLCLSKRGVVAVATKAVGMSLEYASVCCNFELQIFNFRGARGEHQPLNLSIALPLLHTLSPMCSSIYLSMSNYLPPHYLSTSPVHQVDRGPFPLLLHVVSIVAYRCRCCCCCCRRCCYCWYFNLWC
jgi:hypothetical protein